MRLFATKPAASGHLRGGRCALIAAAWLACFATAPVCAHHSMTIFELFPITIEGTVQEFKFVNPHSIIVLQERTASGVRIWHLEGDPPAILDHAGFDRRVFKPGDRLKMQIHRLRSGELGGFWSIRMVIMQNGQEFVGHQCMTSPDHCGAQ